MIDALEHLPSDHMMAFIGGLDGEIGDYSEYAKSKGFAERCIFGPRQEFEKVVLYEQAMDVLAIPYPDKPHFRDYGFPMKVYEYMAAKCPILYSRLELTEEILSDCGFTFQADNPKDFAKNAYAIFDKNNREEVEKKVELAYNKVVELTWKDKVQNIIEFMR